jgi:hypothetical protein
LWRRPRPKLGCGAKERRRRRRRRRCVSDDTADFNSELSASTVHDLVYGIQIDHYTPHRIPLLDGTLSQPNNFTFSHHISVT